MFCDETTIRLIAGKGGDGCSSFRREKFIPKGGPDGGDGGKGGDIILKVNPNLNTLSHLNAIKTYRAKNGDPGKGKNMHGKTGENLTLEVPEGTIIYNSEKSDIIADLNKTGQEIVIARGGKGGLGNARFATSTHQAPRFAENGEPGEEIDVTLELKLVADIGIIGLPSAGKSTLISVISNARPKIAAYHFTTLIPNLGVVNLDRFGGSKMQSFVVADIPGLIEGASEGRGLGHQFLKHIARTKILIHLIDISLDKIPENYKTIRQELQNFDKNLSKKEELIVINKVDLLENDEIKKKIEELKKVTGRKKIYQISGLTKEGLQTLIFDLYKKLEKTNKKEREETKEVGESDITVLRPHLEKVKFKIDKVKQKKNNKVFHLSGERIDQLVIMTDLNNLEGLERIYQYIDKLGIKKAINKEGAKLGDIIKIKGKDIPYRP